MIRLVLILYTGSGKEVTRGWSDLEVLRSDKRHSTKDDHAATSRLMRHGRANTP